MVSIIQIFAFQIPTVFKFKSASSGAMIWILANFQDRGLVYGLCEHFRSGLEQYLEKGQLCLVQSKNNWKFFVPKMSEKYNRLLMYTGDPNTRHARLEIR